jgi:hypothetical protein
LSIGELLKDPSNLVRTWALHSLCLTIEAAGPALSPLAAPALTVLYSLLLNEEDTSTDEFRCIGRVVHDIVSALGPELKATSPIMKKCAAVAIELRVTHYAELKLMYRRTTYILWYNWKLSISIKVCILKYFNKFTLNFSPTK